MNKAITLIIIASLFTILSFGQKRISADEAYKHYGETVTICDRIYGIEMLDNVKFPQAIKVGNSNKKNILSIILTVESIQKLTEKGKKSLLNKDVCVTGKVMQHRGIPEIIIDRTKEIFLLKETGGASEIKPNDFLRFD